MKTTTKQVTTSMTFEVTVILSAIETEDETGADISEVSLDCTNVNGADFAGWMGALRYMTETAQKGDWDHD